MARLLSKEAGLASVASDSRMLSASAPMALESTTFLARPVAKRCTPEGRLRQGSRSVKSSLAMLL